MATPLDFGLLANFSSLFPFLFVTVSVYAGMSKIAPFGADQRGLYAFLAFILGVLTMFSPIAIKTINRMAPWFVLLFIFSIFILMAFKMFGITDETITGIITSSEHGDTFFYWIIALILVIGIGSLTSVVSEEKGFTKIGSNETGAAPEPGTEQVGFVQTIVHPKVLGMILLLLVAAFTVRNLSKYEKA
jgi:hypothetical protein